MDLNELLQQLSPTDLQQVSLPHYLLGSFRRKSISFYNGLTDENTIVYWFQSRTFTLDLRLSDARSTPITERQGWIGDTVWDHAQQLLSWDVQQSYQPRIQWPEPATLHAVGNCLLEFSPSNAYVEDWRQLSHTGPLLGLRLYQVQHLDNGEVFAMDGGLIVAGEHIAYAHSRLPQIQDKLSNFSRLDQALAQHVIHEVEIESYEVSVALNGHKIQYSTQSQRVGESIQLTGFELNDQGIITQIRQIHGEDYLCYFQLDLYQPEFQFVRQSITSDASHNWLQQEQDHLLKNAQVVE